MRVHPYPFTELMIVTIPIYIIILIIMIGSETIGYLIFKRSFMEIIFGIAGKLQYLEKVSKESEKE